jgi:ketosteroid isomerase-like protein
LIPRLLAALPVLIACIAVAAEPDESAIHETYKAWVEATNRKDIEEWSSFLAMHPYFFPADSPPLSNTEEVIDYYAQSFADPLFSLNCRQEHVDVSELGSMAWSRGRCDVTFTGPDGDKASARSRWFKVWIKQPDGAWRCRVNSWRNVD